MIKAIETVYNGYRFRSRLEARWAVFFDALGVEWQYEVEGFDLDGIWYLPDFWLRDPECWIEIKPGLPAGLGPASEESHKAGLLAAHSKKWVNMFCGNPYPDDFRVVSFRHMYPSDEYIRCLNKAIEEKDEFLFRVITYSDRSYNFEDIKQKAIEHGLGRIHLNQYASRYSVSYERNICFCPYHKSLSFGHTFFRPRLHQCPDCGEVHEVGHNNGIEPIVHGRCFKCEMRDNPEDDYSDESTDNQFLRSAYTAARQARFEHGQNGA